MVVAYVLAAVCVLVPLAIVGAAFAGIALMRRNRQREGAGVVILGFICTVIGVIALR